MVVSAPGTGTLTTGALSGMAMTSSTGAGSGSDAPLRSTSASFQRAFPRTTSRPSKPRAAACSGTVSVGERSCAVSIGPLVVPRRASTVPTGRLRAPAAGSTSSSARPR